MPANSLNKKWIQVVMHILAWLLVFSMPYLFKLNSNWANKANPDENGFVLLNTITWFFWVILFYVNAVYMVPRLLYPKKYLYYISVLLLSLLVILGIHIWLFTELIHVVKLNLAVSTWVNLPAFLITVAVSIVYKFLIDRSELERNQLHKQEENLKTEVSFLRSQVSPHFLFNVLNNIVALARQKSDQLEPTVMKLSGLMQYMLYETDEGKVPLVNEIEYLQNYIDLQQQRFGPKVKMNIQLTKTTKPWLVEPMLLIPFVENAFKHGIVWIQQPEIDVQLYEETNGIVFHVRNKFSPLQVETKDKTSGIGLQNVTRRLDLLYPGKHELLMSKSGDIFEITLHLKLNSN